MDRETPPPPLDDPAADLAPVARALLEAAQRIIERRGFAALTLAAVAAESGENKAMVAYYFGNKAGLVRTILDTFIYEEAMAVAAKLEGLRGEERLAAMLDGLREVTASSDRFRGYFDVLPHALRDKGLRLRLVDLYEWYIALELRWLDLDEPAGDPDRQRRLRGLAELICAAIDGIGIQARIDPETFDASRTYEALEILLRNAWSEFSTVPLGR